MVNKLKKILGTVLFGAVIVTSAGTLVQAKEYMQGVRINTYVGCYSRYFYVLSNVPPTPYLHYQQVYTNGRYIVSSLYQNGSSDSLTSVKDYMASSIAQGRLLTGTTFKTSAQNRVLICRDSGSQADLVISYLRVDH